MGPGMINNTADAAVKASQASIGIIISLWTAHD
ncbi:protein of unknown function (plasmid) [Azospirillum baldaniorum]|uniref:Uncharacterized protein n=1 Tax=Azospirillum baldaniorum TaxID=1064539 RepID=A0A9P1JUR8_9PROT|nr:protein of unknown function [Azospirillum baldaniorum]